MIILFILILFNKIRQMKDKIFAINVLHKQYLRYIYFAACVWKHLKTITIKYFKAISFTSSIIYAKTLHIERKLSCVPQRKRSPHSKMGHHVFALLLIRD